MSSEIKATVTIYIPVDKEVGNEEAISLVKEALNRSGLDFLDAIEPSDIEIRKC